MPRLTLHNTMTRQREPFAPLDPANVALYVCGPTVYDFAHIGNARPLVVFDVLARLLRRLYPRVTYVRNITDVDDKINARAAENAACDRRDHRALPRAQYHEDMAAIGALPPDVEPRATEHIAEIVAHDRAPDRERARLRGGGPRPVRRRRASPPTARCPAAARRPDRRRARRSRAVQARSRRLRALEAVAARSCPAGTSPGAAAGPAGTSSARRWPGAIWARRSTSTAAAATRCSRTTRTRSRRASAPSPAAAFARYWLHNGMLTSAARRCRSRSATSPPSARCCARAPGEAIRLLLLRAQYRSTLEFTFEGLREARASSTASTARSSAPRRRSGRAGRGLDALCDDLNTPAAFAAMHELAAEAWPATRGRIRPESRRRRCSACCSKTRPPGSRAASTPPRSKRRSPSASPPARLATSPAPTRSGRSGWPAASLRGPPGRHHRMAARWPSRRDGRDGGADLEPIPAARSSSWSARNSPTISARSRAAWPMAACSTSASSPRATAGRRSGLAHRVGRRPHPGRGSPCIRRWPTRWPTCTGCTPPAPARATSSSRC